MNISDFEYLRLVESLTLTKTYENPLTPEFQGFGGPVLSWAFYGGPYDVHPKHNPKNLKDIIYKNKDNKRHRITGPAYINELYDIEIWYKDGEMHREGGPAYRHKNNFVWFFEGKLHRLDGPAVNELAGPKQYWINGIKFSKKQYYWEIKRRTRRGV